jgi:hypothetical protein
VVFENRDTVDKDPARVIPQAELQEQGDGDRNTHLLGGHVWIWYDFWMGSRILDDKGKWLMRVLLRSCSLLIDGRSWDVVGGG